MAAHHYIVKGRVQGVWFRQSTKERADLLSVSGWVRNLPNGDVEAVACGSPEQLGKLEEWLWQGSPAAVVTAVEVAEVDRECDGGFAIR